MKKQKIEAGSKKNNLLESFFQELTKVRDSQRLLVIVTHGLVEFSSVRLENCIKKGEKNAKTTAT